MLGEITDEIRGALETLFKIRDGAIIGSYRDREMIMLAALRDQLAARLKADFNLARIAGVKNHWTDAQWQAEAERILKGN